MKLDYLNNKSWTEVTREERLFCAELYFEIRNDPKPFFRILDIDDSKKYEVGFEVCFYRDVLHEYRMSAREKKLPSKRTFDLALMSDDEIIIIEAKANQDFEDKQLGYFRKDVEHIKKLFSIIGREVPEIRIFGICSSLCLANGPTNDQAKRLFHEYSGKLITWEAIAKAYPLSREIFEHADATHE